MPVSNIAGSLRFTSADPASGDVWMNGLPIDVVGQIANNLQGVNTDSAILFVFDHMLRWSGPIAEGANCGWLLSGTTGAATIVESNARNGEIILTADATGSCNPTLGLGNTTTNAPFLYTIGKRMGFALRLKVGTVASTEMFVGFGTPDTSPSVTGTFPADGLFFHKTAAATKLSFDARKDGTSTSKATITGTLVDATYTVIGMYVDALGNIQPFQDGTAISAGLIAAGTANIPTTGDVMTWMLGILGASQTCTVDWLLIWQEI